jgi:hypothetical protein
MLISEPKLFPFYKRWNAKLRKRLRWAADTLTLVT